MANNNTIFDFMKYVTQTYFLPSPPQVLSMCQTFMLARTHFYALVCSPTKWFVLAFLVFTVAFRYRRGVLRDRASVARWQASQPRHMSNPDVPCRPPASGPDVPCRPPARPETSAQATGQMQTNLLKLEAMQKQLKQDIIVLQCTQMEFEKQRNADSAKFVVLMQKAMSDKTGGLTIENHKCFLSSLHETNWALNHQCTQRMQDDSNNKLHMMFNTD
jgi:hypothetical protein